MESNDEGVYSDDECMHSEEEGGYSDDEENYDRDIDDRDQDMQKKTYRVLKETDVREIQNEQIQRLSSILSLSKDEAAKLLYHYRWNDSLLLEEWLADEEKVRTKVGLLSSPTNFFGQDRLTTCGICLESFPLDHHHFYPVVCGHTYCMTCWKYYLSISINDGPGCLSLRCPEPECHAAVVNQAMIDKLCSDGEREKYAGYLFRSYVEENKNMKWCPGPGCENAVEFEVDNGVYDVTCLCSQAFCWNCVEEVHRPLDCDTVAKWDLKTRSESENITWIIANSKPCPKCKRPIEKNDGCMHMRCTKPCGFHFCWLCLEAWSAHGKETGGYYECNIYKAAKIEGKYAMDEQRKEIAKNSLKKYTHYYERWVANHKSRQKAIDDWHKIQNAELGKLSNRVKFTDKELVFIKNAWEQIIECRRVLKWSYVYGYYLTEHRVAKKALFEYLQGEAESGLERLHQCAEQELSVFFKDDIEDDQKKVDSGTVGGNEDQKQLKAEEDKPKADFKTLRPKLIDLTIVTRSYFENLVRALENDL